jgi:hypothetical protein
MFKVFYVSRIVAADAVFKKSPQKKLSWRYGLKVLHLRIPARKLLLSHYGQWPHLAETSNSLHFLPAEQQSE